MGGQSTARILCSGIVCGLTIEPRLYLPLSFSWRPITPDQLQNQSQSQSKSQSSFLLPAGGSKFAMSATNIPWVKLFSGGHWKGERVACVATVRPREGGNCAQSAGFSRARGPAVLLSSANASAQLCWHGAANYRGCLCSLGNPGLPARAEGEVAKHLGGHQGPRQQTVPQVFVRAQIVWIGRYLKSPSRRVLELIHLYLLLLV